MANNDTEVAIIGGGAAGIAAGRRLGMAAIQCLVIEARPRLGGRAWTAPDKSGFAFDVGCGWLHSADRNPWTKVAESLAFTIDKSPPPWKKPSIPISFPYEQQEEFAKAQRELYERMEKAAQERDCAASELLEPGNRWNDLLNATSTYISGAEFDRLSIRDLENYTDTGTNWRVVEGYGTTISTYGQSLVSVLDCPVLQIDDRGRRLKIETAKGEITADQAIVTLPTALLAEKEHLFAPALPDKLEAARGLPLGLADKLFLWMDESEQFEPDSRLFGRSDCTATASYQFRPRGFPVIEAYFGGRCAAELEAGGERAFFDFAVEELKHTLGADFARKVKLAHIHPWGIDPFARGSYSYALPGKGDCRAALSAPVEDRLFFAGEACSKHDFSTAHGAYLTGVAAADQVIAARRKKRTA